jgi:hypothetical protein
VLEPERLEERLQAPVLSARERLTPDDGGAAELESFWLPAYSLEYLSSVTELVDSEPPTGV